MRLVIPVATEARNPAVKETAREFAGTALSGTPSGPMPEPCAASMQGSMAAAVPVKMRLMGKPSTVGPATERVLAGFRRKGAERGRGQVAGVQWEQAVAAAVAANDGGSVKVIREACNE